MLQQGFIECQDDGNKLHARGKAHEISEPCLGYSQPSDGALPSSCKGGHEREPILALFERQGGIFLGGTTEDRELPRVSGDLVVQGSISAK
jgi:hypothetical protein